MRISKKERKPYFSLRFTHHNGNGNALQQIFSALLHSTHTARQLKTIYHLQQTLRICQEQIVYMHTKLKVRKERERKRRTMSNNSPVLSYRTRLIVTIRMYVWKSVHQNELSPFRSINFHFFSFVSRSCEFNRIHRKKNEATKDDRIRRDTILQPLLITFIDTAKLCLILDSNVHIFTKQYAYIKANWQLSDRLFRYTIDSCGYRTLPIERKLQKDCVSVAIMIIICSGLAIFICNVYHD